MLLTSLADQKIPGRRKRDKQLSNKCPEAQGAELLKRFRKLELKTQMRFQGDAVLGGWAEEFRRLDTCFPVPKSMVYGDDAIQPLQASDVADPDRMFAPIACLGRT